MGIIQRQSIKNFFTSYVGVIIGFVNIIIIQPRFLSPEELGLTRVLYSFALLLSTFVPMGMANIAIKFFPEFRNKENRHNGFFGFMLLGTVVGFVFTATLLFIFKNNITGEYVEKSKLFADFFYWVFPLIFILTLITQLNIYCYSLYKSTVPAFLNDVMARIGVIVVISLYFLKWFTLKTFIILFVSVYGLQVIALLIYIFYEERPGFKINRAAFTPPKLKTMFTYAAVVWMASVASTGLKELGTILLGTQIELNMVAVYAIAAFIPTIIEVPLNAFDKIATYKIVNALSEKNLTQVDDIFKKSARFMLLSAGLLFLGINCNAQSIVQFLPPTYRDTVQIILIVSCGSLFNMATGLNSQILFYSDKYSYGAASMIFSVIVNYALLMLLIPTLGILGAALATTVSGVAMNLINSFIVWKKFGIHSLEIRMLWTFILIGVIYFIDYFIPHTYNTITDILIHGSFVTILYIAVLWKLGYLTELIDFAKSSFVKKSN